MYNILAQNNLLENIAGGDTYGDGEAFTFGGIDPGWNIVYDHNTVLDTYNGLTTGNGTIPYTMSAVTSGATCGLKFTNNVVVGPIVDGGAGTGLDALNTGASGITMADKGSGYTAVPGVTFSMPNIGTDQATGVALKNGDKVYGIKITHNGSGYTAAPTVTLTGGLGAGGTAAVVGTVSVVLDPADPFYRQVGAWSCSGNVFIGTGFTNYPTGNYYSDATEDSVEFMDTPGDQFNLLPYVNNGTANPLIGYATDHTNPGVNMAALAGITDFHQIDATLHGYWKLDDSRTGTVVADSSSYAHNGTLTSNTMWATTANMNDGIALTGSTNPGSVSVSSFSATPAFTFAAWVKPTNFSLQQYIASSNNGSASSFSLYIKTSGELVAAGTTGFVTGTGEALSANQWYLVGMTLDSSGKLHLYKNGVEIGGTGITGTTTTGTTTLYFGGNQGSANCLNGTIDEVRYYSSALTQARWRISTTPMGRWSLIVNPGGGSVITTATTGLGFMGTNALATRARPG